MYFMTIYIHMHIYKYIYIYDHLCAHVAQANLSRSTRWHGAQEGLDYEMRSWSNITMLWAPLLVLEPRITLPNHQNIFLIGALITPALINPALINPAFVWPLTHGP